MEMNRFFDNVFHESFNNDIEIIRKKLLSIVDVNNSHYGYFDSFWDTFDNYRKDNNADNLSSGIVKYSNRFTGEKKDIFFEVANYLRFEVDKIIEYRSVLNKMIKPSDEFIKKFINLELDSSNAKTIKSIYLEMIKNCDEIEKRISNNRGSDKLQYDLALSERRKISKISNDFMELLYSKCDVKFDTYGIGAKYHLTPLSNFSVGRINREFGQALCKPSLDLFKAHENDINSSGVTCTDCVKRLIDYTFK
jgi:hypothetical protein